MKGFFEAFAMWFVGLLVITIVTGGVIFGNIYALYALIALILAAFTTLIMELSEQVETLQKRVEALEGKAEQQPEESVSEDAAPESET